MGSINRQSSIGEHNSASLRFMADIFISYSRKDKAFIQTLHQALTQNSYDVWVDWEDIPPSAPWWTEIEAGIEAAHTCIFVISPDSVDSEVCHREIDHAANCHKRLIPIVLRDGSQDQQIHPALAELNWLFFRQSDHFDQAFQTLVKTLNTDLDHVRTHTRLLVRAVEWNKQRRNASYLLQGSDLEAAEQWLIQSGALPDPKPTELQSEYIVASRRSANHRQRILIGTLSVLLLAAISLGGLAEYRKHLADQQRILAEQRKQEAEANLDAACRHIFGMLEGFETMEANGVTFMDAEGYSLPVGIIFGQEFIRNAHNIFNTECAEVNETYGWTLNP